MEIWSSNLLGSCGQSVIKHAAQAVSGPKGSASRQAAVASFGETRTLLAIFKVEGTPFFARIAFAMQLEARALPWKMS